MSDFFLPGPFNATGIKFSFHNPETTIRAINRNMDPSQARDFLLWRLLRNLSKQVKFICMSFQIEDAGNQAIKLL